MRNSYLPLAILVLFSCSKAKEVEIIRTSEPDPQEPEPTEIVSTDNGVLRGLTSVELVADMGSGWNLGNTLDVEDEDETLWGNPLTTKEMIDAVNDRGFKTIRVPVTWRFHMGDAPNYTIEKEWLERVQEIVEYARGNDMYVIINIHHDDPWIIPTYEKADEVKDRLAKVWTQIANHFKEYSDYLVFETLNEPRYENSPEEWTGGTAEGRDVVNQYHKACVDAIRATGGNNAMRHLMVSTYAASTGPTVLDALVIPNDDPNIIISLHSYFPFEFCLGGTDTTWGTDADKNALEFEFDKIVNKFVANGRAVIMGEWSSGNQNNTADRLAHADFYSKECAKRGLMPIWWDVGYYGDNASGLMDRNTLEWPYGEIADAVINSRN
ncbi:MAG: glycoside hydrolase family 5 protein [Saonia sp.]